MPTYRPIQELALGNATKSLGWLVCMCVHFLAKKTKRAQKNLWL
jgi:hypothetical protein